MLIEYTSTHSGGSFPLTDDDWLALEEAGWYVIWGGYYFCDSNECQGHRKASNFEDAQNHRFLGAVAREAKKEFESVGAAFREFEKVTGQRVSSAGCACCGPPHSFSWDGMVALE